ncbi:MAG: class III extradiol dioxygenase subunit B-like domain-containing protein [Candidatus Paceibacterota bacterium]
MKNIVFAAISPHPPLILPSVGSKEDRGKVKKTIDELDKLGKEFKEAKPDSIIISSPHADWGFNAPLFFLAKDFKGEITDYLTDLEEPEFYFNKGREIYKTKIKNQKSKFALIASGDLSHCLKEEGPYGFHPEGPRFDEDLIKALKDKNIEKIIKLDDIYPEAGECGLRSICFLLGVLEESGLNWQPEILSYEGPFGVGYLVVKFKIVS